ncbi:hypothetical protein CAC42_2324 [Sphaceloma murrayae]|uniref:F-box domain-containing protein n=1 Tax=Sphaceloma murrayae TaxID=2082308 RepID=A0A2K1QIV7_9PEZI|nr:hypothetical protein CAC42_2324 [Sphaceloma murrayae]
MATVPTTTIVEPLPQLQCPLFADLPGEIRAQIFSLALLPCPSLTARYPRNCLWNRPGHFAPLRTYTDLLRTCKAVHAETWHLPYKHTSLTLYLASFDRRPVNSLNPFVLEEQLKALPEPLGAQELQIFSQLFMLESGDMLQNVLDLPNFAPRRIIITVRHTDFWFWESDEPLRVNAAFVRHCQFPTSVKEVEIRFETVERKKDQVDLLASQAKEWVFARKDEKLLRWKEEGLEKWTGVSTLNQQRWIRDESRPGQIDYVIKSVVFDVPRAEDEHDDKGSRGEDLHVPSDRFEQMAPENASIFVDELKRARVPRDADGQTALEMVRQYREHNENGLHRWNTHWPLSERAAGREEDETGDDVVVEDDERNFSYYFLPGNPEAGRDLIDDRFGGLQSAYEYQYYRRRLVRWLRLREQDEAAAEAVKAEWFPFRFRWTGPDRTGEDEWTTDEDDDDNDDDDENDEFNDDGEAEAEGEADNGEANDDGDGDGDGDHEMSQ